jgi:hypothetical protein
MANLSVNDVGKRNNVNIFAEKVLNKSPFITDQKKEVIIGYKDQKSNKSFHDALKTMGVDFFDTLKQNKSIILPTPDGKGYPLTKLFKSSEFGGAGTGARTAKEDAQLSNLKKEIQEVMDKTKMPYVPIKVQNKVHKVIGAESTPGTPKSDFHLIDIEGKECVWISHKDGKTEKDFQQWGGMTESQIEKHPEVGKFIEDVRKMFPDGIPPATTAARYIKDLKLKNMAVFGVDYGKSESRQNCSVLLQGIVSLKKSGNNYLLNATAHVEYNGETPDGNYEPIMVVIHKCDRANFNIKCARFSIYPKNGRKISMWI